MLEKQRETHAYILVPYEMSPFVVDVMNIRMTYAHLAN